MFLPIQLFVIFIFFKCMFMENIFLPTLIINNQSSSSSVYLCHVHQLNNSDELFLQSYSIINQENLKHIHHLLVYECSIDDKLIYTGLCGKYNEKFMPKLVYRHCQTRIIIAWAKGGQLEYNYPIDTGLKINSYTQFLLEIHFDPFIIYSPRSIGINLKFYSNTKKPKYEIGVLTIGTLANSSLYLPPRLNLINFPTYCFNDCLKLFLKNHFEINIFSILVHAHQYAKRIILEDNYLNRLIDKNPFEYHRQEMNYFSPPYPKLNSTYELSLICSYSTKNNSFQIIYGGHNSNNEMCQAFLYYYPKISLFPLCLSLPIYDKKYFINLNQNWTDKQSLLIKNRLESNKNHLSICGDNIYLNNTNQTILHMEYYQRSMKKYSFDYFYSIVSFFLFTSIIYCYLIIKKNLHSLYNGGTLLYSFN